MQTLPESARRFVVVVTIAGLAVCALAAERVTLSEHPGLAPWLIALVAILGEMVPIKIPFHGDRQVVTLSTTFVFALLLLNCIELAILAQAVGSLASDLARSKPWWKALFNSAQYALAVGLAGLIIYVFVPHELGPPGSFTPWALFIVLVSGMTLYVTNNALIGTAIALSQGVKIRMLRNDVLFQAAVMLVLLSQAPLLVLALDQGPWVLPLFTPSVAVAYRNSRVSVQRDHEARHDHLTGLQNRSALHQHIRDELAAPADGLLAVLLIDLDGFREVNETLGHGKGDRLLVEIATRLQSQMEEREYVARMGGDEFAIVASVADEAAVTRTVERAIAAISQPFHLDGIPFRVRASIGGALAPEHGTAPGILLQRAEIAMYLAKESRSPYELYRTAIDPHDPRRLSLMGELHRAIETDEICVYFQPVASLGTGEVIGAEALVRWIHPRHGLIPPDEFVPLAETTGDIHAMTLKVARLAIAQCARWRALHYDMHVAINVSPTSLQASLPSELQAMLNEHALPASALMVEVTETGVMRDPVWASQLLLELRNLGIHVALDDFGTGESSLGQLRRLPVDHIKIDRSFVSEMLTSDDDAAIVETTVTLGHTLGLVVVAEGVESDAAWRALQQCGCDSAQGYYLARPQPADKFVRWLSAAHGTGLTSSGPATARPPVFHLVPGTKAL